MSALRLGFSGSSGTGKTTLAAWAALEYGLELCPVGSRSVARAMCAEAGIEELTPYEARAAFGDDAFQRRLFHDKEAWELAHHDAGYAADRTFADDLAYGAMHGAHAYTPELLAQIWAAQDRYTHIFYLPFYELNRHEDDPARRPDPAYQELYDAVLHGLLERSQRGYRYVAVWDLEQRKVVVRRALGPGGGIRPPGAE